MSVGTLNKNMALTDNLLYYYKFQGNSNDSVGSNNGSDTSITYSTGNGKIDQGAGFNGSTSQIAYSTSSSLSTALTFSMWIKPTSVTTRQGVFAKTDGAGNSTTSWVVELTAAGKMSLNLSAGGSGVTVQSTSSISAGVWTYVCCTWDGSTITWYLNGSSDNTGAAILTINNITQATILGQFGSYNLLPYGGAIDEFGVWNRALSGSEITELYNSGSGNQYPYSLDVTVNPSTLSSTLSIPAYTVSAVQNVTVSSGVFSATFSIPAYTVQTDTSVSPSVQSATFSIPQHEAYVNDAVVFPSAQSATFSIPAYTVDTVQNITIGATTPFATFSTPSPSIITDVSVSSSVAFATFSIPTYSVDATISVSVSATTQALTFTIPAYQADGIENATNYPSAQALTFSIPTYSVVTIANISVSVEAMVATFAIPTYRAIGDFWQNKYPSNPSSSWSNKY